MDEPAAGMAPSERRGLMALTARIARERGIGVLFTEHDMDVVFGHADRVLVLNRGELIAEGAPEEVRAREDVRRVYLGAGALRGRLAMSAGLRVRDLERRLRPRPRAVRRLARSRARRGGGAARPQRRGQVDDVPRDPRPAARRAAARSLSPARTSLRLPTHAIVRLRPRLCAGGPAHLLRSDGRGKPQRRPPRRRARARRPGRRRGCSRSFPILRELRHRPGARMSGGEQQMLAIARTLMGNPVAAAARRALGGPGAAHRRADDRGHRPR